MSDTLFAPPLEDERWGPSYRPRQMPPAPAWRRDPLDYLQESEEALDYALWLCIRRVRDWVDTPPSARASLVSTPSNRDSGGDRRAERWVAAREAAPELRTALTTFESLWWRADASPPLVAEACDHVSQWAERRGLPETCLQFAEAAAALEPESAKRANFAGRACRINGSLSRADIWYQRGLTMARQEPSRVELFRGNLGAGAVAYLQGRYRDARPCFVTGAWKARDMGRLPLAARAQHDLMLLNVEVGKLGKAVTHARRALHWYPRHHVRIPYLVHDFAFFLTRLRLERAALDVLHRAYALIPAEHERLLVWGTIARAAGGAGDFAQFSSAKEQVAELAKRYAQHAAHALYEVAAGARLLNLWEECEKFAHEALAKAREQGRGDTEQDAKRLLRAVASRLPLSGATPLAASHHHWVANLTREYIGTAEKWSPRPDLPDDLRPERARSDP